MTHLMETVESQRQASHCFPRALGNLATSARFPHSLSSGNGEWEWKTIALITGASRAPGLHPYLTQPTPAWVTSLNELTGTRRKPLAGRDGYGGSNVFWYRDRT